MGVADELTKLVALRDSGVITPEEFDQQRANLLASTAPIAPPPPTAPTVSWGPMSQASSGMLCSRCHKPLSTAWLGKCNHCGAAYAEFPPMASGVSIVPVPGSAYRRAQGWTLRKKLAVLGVGIVGLAIVAGYGGNRSGNTGAAATTRPASTQAPVAKNLVGTFVEWVPVDEANGYAHFTIKNNGTTTVTAECTVSVSNDFGNFGFDSLVGEQIAPGETISGRMAISVSEGSFLINEGEVKDC